MPDSEADFSAEIKRADRMGAMLVALPKWIAWAIIAWQVRLSINALVGENAMPSLLMRFWRQASVWEVGCWAAGLLGLIFGIYSRYLYNRQVTRDWSRISSLEKRLDSIEAGIVARSGANEKIAN